MAEMELLKAKFEKLWIDINYDIKGMLDDRGVGVNEFHTNSIRDAIRDPQEQMHDLITRVTVFRPNLEYDVSSTPEEQFTFADDTELVEDEIHNVLSDEVATVQKNATVGSIMQRRRKMNENRLMRRRRISLGFHNGKLQVLPPL